jgi:hypothetical protein
VSDAIEQRPAVREEVAENVLVLEVSVLLPVVT